MACSGPLRLSGPGKPPSPGTSFRVPPNCVGDTTERLAAHLVGFRGDLAARDGDRVVVANCGQDVDLGAVGAACAAQALAVDRVGDMPGPARRLPRLCVLRGPT